MSILFSHFLSQNNEIRPQEADFTEVLSTIAVVPKMLYFYGKIPKNRLKSVAIVGTRKPTAYGGKVAYELGFAAAKRGAVVVSGLAYGIDGIAHRAALDAGGVTVAVLGTPIDKVYPKGQEGLAREIIEKGGAVISEVPPGAEYGVDYYGRTCFLERNRIISGLADVVVVVEAARRSGALNTAAHAIEQGREVFAVPGDITRPMSEGCNRLIQSGASVYTGVEEVLRLLFPARRCRKRVDLTGDTEAETAVLGAIGQGVADRDEIVKVTGLRAAEVGQVLTLLEIKGRIKALGMNQWGLG